MPIVHFLTQTEGFRAVTERDQFENIFLPNLWHLQYFTQPQNAASGWPAVGCVWSPARHRRLGRRSHAPWKQQLPTAWGQRAALEKALSSLGCAQVLQIPPWSGLCTQSSSVPPGLGTPVLAGSGRLNQLCAAAGTPTAMSLPGGLTQNIPPLPGFSRILTGGRENQVG